MRKNDLSASEGGIASPRKRIPLSLFCIAFGMGVASAASSEGMGNASAAIAALQDGLKPGSSLESSQAAGQRAEELMSGVGGGPTVSGKTPAQGATHFLSRLIANMPRKKGPIIVQEPASYKDSLGPIGATLGGVSGFLATGFKLISFLWQNPFSFDALSLASWLVAIAATAVFAGAWVGATISSGVLGNRLGRLTGTFIDRHWPK